MLQQIQRQQKEKESERVKRDEPIYDVACHRKKLGQDSPSPKVGHRFIKNSSGSALSRGSKVNPSRYKVNSDIENETDTTKPSSAEIGSISAMSSISNYLNRKKKLSQSFERLNAVVSGRDRARLIENEEKRDNGDEDTAVIEVKKVSASIEFKESDFVPKLTPSRKKRDARIEIWTPDLGWLYIILILRP